MAKPFVISIAGASGVGKTTIAKLLTHILSQPTKSVLHLSGDDLHKWERNNPNWDVYTHFNPEANNLELGDAQLNSLMEGIPIIRDLYDHDTGEFIPEMPISSSDIIINEGLHSLYNQDMCQKFDLNIFVDTERQLAIEWKLNRDTTKRGYTSSQVESIIKRRQLDQDKHISPQISNADVVINFTPTLYKGISLKTFSESQEHPIISKLKNFYSFHKDFLLTCRTLAFEYSLVQSLGGNVSYKTDDKIVITSSGKAMGDVSLLEGYSVCNLNSDYVSPTSPKPSMELPLHKKIPHPVVIHTHPIYLNTILCSKESYNVIESIFPSYPYEYVKYFTPGQELANGFFPSLDKKIYFLENHGLICCGDSFNEVLNLTLKINQMCKKWLIENSLTFANFTHDSNLPLTKQFLFPDAAVLVEENKTINNYITHIQKESKLTPRFLSSKEISKLRNMSDEKYRQNLL